MRPVLLLLAAALCCPVLGAQKPVPSLLWSGSWESEHNLSNRADFNLSFPRPGLALRAQVLDRRPAFDFGAFRESFGGETADKAITQPGFGLYHLSTGSRLLYGTLTHTGLGARVNNIWVRGAPFAESRTESRAELRTSAASTAEAQGYARLESPALSLGAGKISGFSFAGVNDDPENREPVFGAGLGYELGKAVMSVEGLYTEHTMPERTSTTWFDEEPPLPARDSRLFAGAAAFSLPAFGLAADFAASETFAFGRDVYGSLGLRFGDNPWRFSLAFDGAGSRYVDGSGRTPGAGFRSAARLERRSKKSGLFRLTALFRGPGPEQGLWAALGGGDFSAIIHRFDRISGELYCRLPAGSAPLRLSRFSLSAERDGRDTEKVFDSGELMAALKIGPVDSVSTGKLSFQNHGESAGQGGSGYELNSYRITQRLSATINLPASRKTLPDTASGGTSAAAGTAGGSPESGVSAKPVRPKTPKKAPLTLRLTAGAAYEHFLNKEGIWTASASASLQNRRNRFTLKAAASNFPQDWEYTLGWRLLF